MRGPAAGLTGRLELRCDSRELMRPTAAMRYPEAGVQSEERLEEAQRTGQTGRKKVRGHGNPECFRREEGQQPEVLG